MKLYFLCSQCFYASSGIREEDADHGTVQILQTTFHEFSYDELKLATNGFRSSSKIGEGGFGTVYKGRLQNGATVAIKVLSAESNQGDKEFMSEIASMSNINHENLVKLHGGCISGPYRILVYEYVENNSLTRLISGRKRSKDLFGWDERRRICLGIARGLSYIHDQVRPYIVHRDIKASNVVLDENYNPKISDFGLSKLFPENTTHVTTRVAGTLGYLAPEYAISGRLTRKSDVYSFGVLILEIISGRPAVDFDLELGEHFLVEKAWKMYENEKLIDLVDSKITSAACNSCNLSSDEEYREDEEEDRREGEAEEEEACRFLKVALLCVQENSRLRPTMSFAMKMLTNEVNVDDVAISRPGLINSFMDVKVGKSSASSRRTNSAMQSPQSLHSMIH